MECVLIKPNLEMTYLFGHTDLKDFFSLESQEILHEVNCHLDLLDEQLEKLEANKVDVYWQVPTSVSFELAEIQYKLIKAKERMERVLSIKKARRGA